jgi:hypothetical protein
VIIHTKYTGGHENGFSWPRLGLLLFERPEQRGDFSVLMVVVSLVGAIGGSAANLMYPVFLAMGGEVILMPPCIFHS